MTLNKNRVTISIPKDIHREFAKAAIDHDRSIIDITVEAVLEWLAKHSRKQDRKGGAK